MFNRGLLGRMERLGLNWHRPVSVEVALMGCPLCGCERFVDFRGRSSAQCENCKSLERARYLWLLMVKAEALNRCSRVLHVAPEQVLISKIRALVGDGYHPCDFNPSTYRNKIAKVYEFDFCRDTFRYPSSIFDVIIHNHVLEHIPCAVEPVLRETIRLLAPGGHMFFSVPFREGLTEEGAHLELNDAERTFRFGQSDHLRIFGTKDFPAMLKTVFAQDLVENARSLVSERDLRGRGIPLEVLTRISGHSIFYFRKSA